MPFLKKNKYFLTCCALLVALVFVSVYEPQSWIPTPNYPNITTSERTYDLKEYPQLPNEIIGLFNYFRDILFSQGVNEFANMEPYIGGLPIAFGPGGDAGLRYVLAFSAYTIAEMMATTPGYRDPSYYQNTSDWMIQKMEAPKVREYWNSSPVARYDDKTYYQYTIDHYGVPAGDGYGLNYTNIMYRAHWILMQALYQYLFNDTKYHSNLKFQIDALYDEMTNASNPTHFIGYGVPCEPVEIFSQCQTPQSLAFKMYDSALNTTPTNYYSAIEKWLEWSLENMTNADGLFYNGINVTKFENGDPNFVLYNDSGYTQGWTIAFINAYNQTIAQNLYPKFKDVYVKDIYPGIIGDIAYVTEYAYADPFSTDIMEFAWSIVSTGFGIMAAREMGDQVTLDKFLNWANHLFMPKWEGNTYSYSAPGFEGMEFVINMILHWGSQGPWVTLNNFTQRKSLSFWTQPYIVDVSDVENIFINQAYYDETNSAFILTCSTGNPGTITLTNALGGSVYSAQNSGFSTSAVGNNITINVNRGSFNFVVEF